MDRPHVLVVEDRPSVLKLMTTILEQYYDVRTAADGGAALDLVGAVPLDVVLTDIRMPRASGFDVLRAVRSRAPSARVVMMTAFANVADAVAAIKLGAFDYVVKPADADEIALVVARALESRREATEPVAEAMAPWPVSDGPQRSVDFHHAVEEARDQASREYLVELMTQFHGNVTDAAKRAGMTRESLHRVLKRYGVRSEGYKNAACERAAAK